MQSLFRLRTILGSCILVTVCLGLLIASPAHAAPRSAALLRSQAENSTPLVQNAPTDTNALLDADLELSVVRSSDSFFAAEGWLHLVPKGGAYTGTFVDNLAGGKIYPATATGVSTSSIDGTYTINTGNGRFVVKADTAASSVTVTVPAKYGAGTMGAVNAHVHAYRANPPLALTITPLIGGTAATPLTGQLAVVSDSFAFIVPTNKTLGAVSVFTMHTGAHTRVFPISAGSRYSAVIAHGGEFAGAVRITAATYLFTNSQPAVINGAPAISGDVYMVTGTTFTQGYFVGIAS